MAVYYTDTIVHGYDRILPLEYDEDYQRALSMLKKLANETEMRKKNELIVMQKQNNVKDNVQRVLPGRTCLNKGEPDMAIYVEGKVAQEMIASDTVTIQPDGTSRAKIIFRQFLDRH